MSGLKLHTGNCSQDWQVRNTTAWYRWAGTGRQGTTAGTIKKEMLLCSAGSHLGSCLLHCLQDLLGLHSWGCWCYSTGSHPQDCHWNSVAVCTNRWFPYVSGAGRTILGAFEPRRKAPSSSVFLHCPLLTSTNIMPTETETCLQNPFPLLLQNML